ncbi:hypothetical protein MKX03_025204 [Papaver bracteatum]|nr:hypothetical protein MKX03_025204 [Papaver bracteatum]
MEVLRDGKWNEEDASILVPGDVISIKLGDIVPADARLLDGDPLKIDQSALTGESLPVTKGPGDGVYSGSTCKQGEIEAIVIATGVHTFFGKAAHLVDSTNQVGHFQKVLTTIGNSCICSIIIGMVIEVIIMYPVQNRDYRPGIDNLLVLLIGGIPIAMPTVLSCSQDAIDTAIVGMLADPKEARAGIQEVHFLPFNPIDKRTALTYIDNEGKMHRVSKGAPKQRALELGVSVKMITGDQLAIGKETGRRLGMGTNMYPSSALLGQSEDESVAALPVDELILVFFQVLLSLQLFNWSCSLLVFILIGFLVFDSEHKYEIVKHLQARKHICGMTGDGVNDAPALKKADIGIAVVDSTDAARSASDTVLTETGLSVIISAVLTSRAIFQRMKNYTIYAVSITIRVVLGFMLLALIWQFDFPPFMVLIIAILNDGTIMTISKDRVKPSPLPDSWKLAEIFATGVILGTYMAIMTVIFFWAAYKTDFFPHTFGVHSLKQTERDDIKMLSSAVYLQVSTISQALIFVTRSRSWSFVERPGILLVAAFLVAQLIATVIAVHANWAFAAIEGIGWGWAGVIWLYNIVFYFPLDILKFIIRYAISGRAWDLVIEKKVAFTRQKDFGKEARELQWAAAQRTLHGLHPPDTKMFHGSGDMAEEAKRRAQITRLRELHTLKGHVESVVRRKGLDIDTIQQAYTV